MSKLNYIWFILLALALGMSIGHAQCPGGCITEIRMVNECQQGFTELEAQTNGNFLYWSTEGSKNSIADSLTVTTKVNPSFASEYFAYSEHLIENQIPLGAFDTDSVFFESEYTFFDSVDFTTNNFILTKDPSDISPALVSKLDYNNRGGYMLLVDGSEDTTKAFFIDSVKVDSGTTYRISLAAANVHENFKGSGDHSEFNSAIIEILVNEKVVKITELPFDTSWNIISLDWVADTSGSISFMLKDKNPRLKENDLVIDDIIFSEVIYSSDTILVQACNTENVFSPDGDGNYDTYYITGSGIARIYNSNGQLINELSLPSHWDGKTHQGQDAPTDYYSIIIDNKKVRHVTLMR